MRRELALPLTLAAFILAAIIVIAPHATVVTNEGSAEMYGVDVVSLTMNAQDLPEQRFPAH
jgi:hypothetical protein